jgi:amino acid transporter
VLTIAISVASGVDAIFSFLPEELRVLSLPSKFIIVGLLTTLNVRGIKESVTVLLPIFITFMITHIGLVLYGLFAKTSVMGHLLTDTVMDTRAAISDLGMLGVIAIFLKAFSLGGGTFTGIEAVSNSTDILREPRAETGKRTMMYMATSLAFMAGGITLCYLLNNVHHEPGRTLNASLWTILAGGWKIGELDIGPLVVVATLLSEGALLFVAAQTGFVAGPRTLAAMAVDQWVPKRFAHLSERLVTQNGVISMSIAAALVLLYTRGAVKILIVMYSINVFMTFTLTQAGMVRHWWNERKKLSHWRRSMFIAALGTVVTAGILVVTAVVKFQEGGWVTLLATSALVAFCFIVRGHYRRPSPRRCPSSGPTAPPRSFWSRATPGSASIRCCRSSACSRGITRTSCSARSVSWTRASSRARPTWTRSSRRCAPISRST